MMGALQEQKPNTRKFLIHEDNSNNANKIEK